MEKKLKILQLSPQFPFPDDDGGRKSIANEFRYFSKLDADVTLFTFAEHSIKPELLQTANEFGEVVVYKHSIKNTFSRILKSYITRKSLYIEKHKTAAMVKFLYELHQKKQFDLVHCDHSSMAPLGLELKKKFNIPVGLRLQNIEWLIWQRYADTLPALRPAQFFISQQAKLLKKAEAKLFEQVDACFTITDVDRERALEIAPDSNVIVASAGVDLNTWQTDYVTKRNNNEMVLATNYKWIHNLDGLKWFIDRVLPEVLKEVPEAKLTLLGKDIPEWLKKSNNPAIQAIGYVDKVQPFLNRATCLIVPLFVGSGIRIKILDAMAMELPVVSTSIGAEGINASEDEGLFIANDEHTFAQKIIYLFKNIEYTNSLRKISREFIQNNFSWKVNVNKMLTEYKRICNK